MALPQTRLMRRGPICMNVCKPPPHSSSSPLTRSLQSASPQFRRVKQHCCLTVQRLSRGMRTTILSPLMSSINCTALCARNLVYLFSHNTNTDHSQDMVRKAIWPDRYPQHGRFQNLTGVAGTPLFDHTDHCLNSLRESLMCNADTTPFIWRWSKKHQVCGISCPDDQ